MNKTRMLLLAGCTALCVLSGCAKQQQFETLEQICVSNTNKADVVQAGEDVLGRMYFTVDKVDVENGYIKTRPLAGAQFFEFWRKDNVGAYNAGEANLHTIRRTAELNITEQGGQLCIGCDVKTQRLSLSEREVASSSHAYGMFSKSNKRMQTLEIDSQQKAWIDLGKDTKLSTLILKRLEEELATN